MPDLPEGVEHILFKSLAKQPEDRYEDMNALIMAMEGVLRDAQKVEVPTPVKELKKQATPRAKSSRNVVMAVIGAFAVILVLVFGMPWALRQFSPASLATEPVMSDVPIIETAIVEIPSTNLLAYYPFHGNANDESGNGNHGTVYGATLTKDRFGNPDQAYWFNGQDSHIDFPGITNGLPNGTITLWFKADDWNVTGLNGIYIFSGNAGGNAGDGINLGTHPSYAGGNSLLFGIFEFSTGIWRWAKSGITPQIGEWYCLAGTWGENGIKFYVNGSLAGEEQYTGPAPKASYSRAGASSWSETNITGSIDDVRIYNRALSSEEVSSLCNRTTTSVFLQPTLTHELTPTPKLTETPLPIPTNTPVPAWVTDFAEPILKAISDRPPTYEDDFSNPYSGGITVKLQGMPVIFRVRRNMAMENMS